MSAFKHVLVATDFSEAAERAKEMGIDLAEKFGAKLTILFVLAVPGGTCTPGTLRRFDDLQQDAAKTLDAEAKKAKERLPEVQSLLRIGTVSEEILNLAKETGVDLIVMGTRGRRGLPRALLGSVAERVVRMATVPVLTAAASAAERDASADDTQGPATGTKDCGG